MDKKYKADLEKLLDTLNHAADFFEHRDRMNAKVHLATEVRFSPLTSEVLAARDRVVNLVLEGESEEKENTGLPNYGKKFIAFTVEKVDYILPVEIVACDKASYYARERNDPKKVFTELFESVLKDPDMAIDWLQNNMDWDQFSGYLILKGEGVPEEPEDWMNTEFTVITEHN